MRNLYLILFPITIVVVSHLANDVQAQGIEECRIHDRTLSTFINRCLAQMKKNFGPAALEIKKVNMYLIRDRYCHNGYTGNGGVFFITVTSKPSETKEHRGLLLGSVAHEVMHLQNIYLGDPYIEGLCCVFSLDMLKNDRAAWEKYETFLVSGRNPCYTLAYAMMRDLRISVGESNYNRILKYIAKDKENGNHMHIDVNRWLSSLNFDERRKAREVILRYADFIKKTARAEWKYEFDLPNP